MTQEAAVKRVCPQWQRQQDMAANATALFCWYIPPLLFCQCVFLLCLLEKNLGDEQCHRSRYAYRCSEAPQHG